LRELARYGTTEYDWRKCEARLNALPQFTTENRRSGDPPPSMVKPAMCSWLVIRPTCITPDDYAA
jgi:hypothetical protein